MWYDIQHIPVLNANKNVFKAHPSRTFKNGILLIIPVKSAHRTNLSERVPFVNINIVKGNVPVTGGVRPPVKRLVKVFSLTGSSGKPGRASQVRLHTIGLSEAFSPNSPISLWKSAFPGFQ
jgi:hypothetical protein